MKLLILTQKVDKSDPILGFFHKWIEEFAKHCDRVTVICLEGGRYDLPQNVGVLSLGKEKGYWKFRFVTRFYRFVWKYRREYDTVFVHMNPEYVVLGGLLWRAWHKRIALWYVHRQVNLKLRIAAMLSNVIFTSAPESFGIKSPKVQYVGHGIDVSRFANIPAAIYEPLTVSHIGRVTPIKRIEVIIEALKHLLDQGVNAELKLVGEPLSSSDRVYKEKLVTLAQKLGVEERVIWAGAQDARQAFTEASITVNAAPDGGMDKAVLESLAACRATFVSNKAFASVLIDETEIFLFPSNNAEVLAGKIKDFLKRENTGSIISELSAKTRREYGVSALIETIVRVLHQVSQ